MRAGIGMARSALGRVFAWDAITSFEAPDG